MNMLKDYSGPLDAAEWPQRLTARVVTPGAAPRLHGYDVEGDLARHYSFAEVVLLSLTGELPTAEVARAFEVALKFAAPAPVHEAPTHAAVLARICVASTSQMQGVAAIALAEQARVLVAEHRAWIEVLSGPIARVPRECLAADLDDRAAARRLRVALHGTIDVPALTHDLSRAAALVATLYACGLTTADRMECALVLARLPVAMAEALATPPGSHRQYPVQLPAMVYTEDSAP
jgi:citrate synthase